MPDHALIRAYIDANVLFSATYQTASDFLELWVMLGVLPITSHYAVEEVSRNVVSDTQSRRLAKLLEWSVVEHDPLEDLVPSQIALATKDRPILSAAVASRCDYLLTGDKKHFAALYGESIGGVHILSARDFRRLFQVRIDLDMLAYNFSQARGW